MGVSGADKTTLMVVLAGRKTSRYIDGSIKISCYPKKQVTFARISSYCEQNDIHSLHVTVYECLLYSAWLRLPAEVDSNARKVSIYCSSHHMILPFTYFLKSLFKDMKYLKISSHYVCVS